MRIKLVLLALIAGFFGSFVITGCGDKDADSGEVIEVEEEAEEETEEETEEEGEE